MHLDRLVRAEISKDNFLFNIESVKKLLKPRTKYMAVVKANAYGHGLKQIAQIAEPVCDFFGVVCLKEVKELRESGVVKPIVILNYTDADSLSDAVDFDARITVVEKGTIDKIDRLASKKNKKVLVHIKVDTGMHRFGVSPDSAIDLLTYINRRTHVQCEGIFTHFATADEADLSFANTQLDAFIRLIQKLETLSLRPPIVHCANSAATLRMPLSHFNLVRPGIVSYGLSPSDDCKIQGYLKPVMSVKTFVVQIREIEKGESVGYGRNFIAKEKTKIALLPVGYGDGLRRSPKHTANVLVGNRKAPIVGRISMDQTTVNVTNIPNVNVGSEVVIIGEQGKSEISSDTIAKDLGTINYEVVTGLSQRVARVVI